MKSTAYPTSYHSIPHGLSWIHQGLRKCEAGLWFFNAAWVAVPAQVHPVLLQQQPSAPYLHPSIFGIFRRSLHCLGFGLRQDRGTAPAHRALGREQMVSRIRQPVASRHPWQPGWSRGSWAVPVGEELWHDTGCGSTLQRPLNALKLTSWRRLSQTRCHGMIWP